MGRSESGRRPSCDAGTWQAAETERRREMAPPGMKGGERVKGREKGETGLIGPPCRAQRRQAHHPPCPALPRLAPPLSLHEVSGGRRAAPPPPSARPSAKESGTRTAHVSCSTATANHQRRAGCWADGIWAPRTPLRSPNPGVRKVSLCVSCRSPLGECGTVSGHLDIGQGCAAETRPRPAEWRVV